MLQRRSEYSSCTGKYASALPGIPRLAEYFDLWPLQNLDAEGSVREAWPYDEETGDLLGGWCKSFASTTIANRWYHHCRSLVHTQFPFKHGKACEYLTGGWMAGAGLTLTRRTGELHAYLSKPHVCREPDGLTARANCSAGSNLV
ncbi:MAG: hypothetical protein BJ554DRAFT_8329 [Olpidium bornovanus]|uniref:Uncharacterized protein n=1 Tax=Olpidium bornovanus TaxID=278681 RepID=A0A8H7ZUH6_9FUNG|nr:MAG: hypothetical protein BJ554DRAFT_8329 [Olpidium bornovanus]